MSYTCKTHPPSTRAPMPRPLLLALAAVLLATPAAAQIVRDTKGGPPPAGAGGGRARRAGADAALPPDTVKLPATAPARRLRELFDAVASEGGEARYKAFLKESISDSLIARRGEPRLLGMMHTLHDNEGGFVVTKVERSADTAIVVLATSRRNADVPFRVNVNVERGGPRKIVGMGIETLGPIERE